VPIHTLVAAFWNGRRCSVGSALGPWVFGIADASQQVQTTLPAFTERQAPWS
jgi:hypothetical protein